MKLLTVVAVFLLAGLAAAPSQCLAGAREGLNLCANIIIPSLFPFFVCSKLLIITGAAEKIGKWCQIIMRPLFNVPGCASVALVLGLLSGYPVGARCGVDLYEKLCTKSEAQRIVCFCNNCGPLFYRLGRSRNDAFLSCGHFAVRNTHCKRPYRRIYLQVLQKMSV